MDKMIGGFNDRAEIAANLLYPIGRYTHQGISGSMLLHIKKELDNIINPKAQ